MIKVAPSLLSANFSDLKNEVSRLEELGVDWLHLDVMDGHFVPNITFGPPVIKAIRSLTSLTFDAHLMIQNPDSYFEVLKESGVDIITVHQEVCPHLHKTIDYIKKLGLKAGVALNPATPVSTIQHILSQLDLVLIMSVNPGFSGQSFIEDVLVKVRELDYIRSERNLKMVIEVDGGINDKTAPKVRDAGADILVSGSYLLNNEDPIEALKLLRGV